MSCVGESGRASRTHPVTQCACIFSLAMKRNTTMWPLFQSVKPHVTPPLPTGPFPSSPSADDTDAYICGAALFSVSESQKSSSKTLTEGTCLRNLHSVRDSTSEIRRALANWQFPPPLQDTSSQSSSVHPEIANTLKQTIWLAGCLCRGLGGNCFEQGQGSTSGGSLILLLKAIHCFVDTNQLSQSSFAIP